LILLMVCRLARLKGQASSFVMPLDDEFGLS
jgi:hypothetical protein